MRAAVYRMAGVGEGHGGGRIAPMTKAFIVKRRTRPPTARCGQKSGAIAKTIASEYDVAMRIRDF